MASKIVCLTDPASGISAESLAVMLVLGEPVGVAEAKTVGFGVAVDFDVAVGVMVGVAVGVGVVVGVVVSDGVDSKDGSSSAACTTKVRVIFRRIP